MIWVTTRPILMRAIRCQSSPCQLTAWQHTCGNWLIFDGTMDGFHDEVSTARFHKHYRKAKGSGKQPQMVQP